MPKSANSSSDQPYPHHGDGAAGLSHDYLNHYNEVLMLIELSGHDSSLNGALLDWCPLGYVEYFASSRWAGASQARAAYEELPPEARRCFERLLATMETLATIAVFALQPPCEPMRAAVVVDATAPVLRRLISSASRFLNSGGHELPEEAAVSDAQTAISTILSRDSDRA